MAEHTRDSTRKNAAKRTKLSKQQEEQTSASEDDEADSPNVNSSSQPDVSLSSCARYARCLSQLYRLQQHYCDQKQDFIATHMLTECLVPAATGPSPIDSAAGEPIEVKCEPHSPVADSEASTSNLEATNGGLLECDYCPFKDASSTVMQAHREKHKSYTQPFLCIHCTYKCTCDVASAEDPCLRCKYSCTRDLGVVKKPTKTDGKSPKTQVVPVACPLAGCQFLGPSELQTAVHLIMQHDYALSCGCLPDGPPHMWPWEKSNSYINHLRLNGIEERPIGLQYLRLKDVAPVGSLQPMPTKGGDRRSAGYRPQPQCGLSKKRSG